MLTLTGRSATTAAESHPEVRVLEALRDRGVPVERQVSDLALPNGRSIRVDLAVPGLRWGIEVDVHPDHLLLDGTTKDKQRDRQCHLIGWRIERITALDLLAFRAVIDELVMLYEQRRRELRLAG